jgi:putative DNA primase/helicase
MQDREELLREYDVITFTTRKDRATGLEVKVQGAANNPQLAKLLMYGDNEHYLVTRDNQEILRYNNSYYENNAACIINNRINYYMDILTTNRMKSETIGFIKNTSYTERKDLEQPLNLINLKNGIYNIDTGELISHDPKYTFLYELPIDYNPVANCPTWKKFIEDTLYKEDVEFIQELCGYLLYRSYPWALLVILLGHGRNGKSTFINVLTAILGKENTVHIPLLTLAINRFAKAKLYQKHANLCADLGAKEIKDTGTLKQLTGMDTIYAEEKHEKGFGFVNFSKLMFACNILPTIDDRTLAMIERIAVVEFPNTFERGTEECDPHIIDKLTTPEELSGIFNWMVEGLKRLLANKKFSTYRDFDNVSEYLKASQDPVNMFVERFIFSDPNGEIQKETVYNQYLKFATDNKFPTVISAVFTKKFKPCVALFLKETGKLDEGQPRTGGHKPTWKGIGLCDKEVTVPTKTEKQQKEHQETIKEALE